MKIILPDKNLMQELMLSDQGRQIIFPTERYYSFPLNLIYLQRLKMVLKLLGEKKCEKLLDIGFGSGIFLPSLSQKTEQLFGLDCHDYINLVKEVMEKTKVKIEIKKGSILQIPYEDNYFDCVNCLSVLEIVEDTEKAISEIARVSKPEAKIIIGAPMESWLTDIAYKLIGRKDQNKKHPANHKKIIKTASKYLEMEKMLTMPSLFFVGLFHKIH